jgi:hypothetical protein
MSKELKLLLISLLCLVLTVGFIYWQQNYTCSTIEYQDLQGTHSMSECTKNKPKTCWDNYPTEQQAILNCEGENK